ncbi:hypothetical protein, partial [Methanoregula sp.]|uniref:hypothetical protein n=1 Tax=Methanoregula sp. TaxID=2052170 RepID=UPI000CAEC951
LEERPAEDPTEWILKSMTAPGDTSRPVESSSLFEPLYHFTTLCSQPRVTVPEEKRRSLIHAVLRFRNADNGLGLPFSTMI